MPLLPDPPMAPDRFPALDAAELRQTSEARRLGALQSQLLMDTPPEPGLDALVRLAARALEVPIFIAHGDDDQIVPIADSALLAVKLLRKGELKVYKGLAHGMATTEAELINKDLLAFFKA